MSVKSTVIDVVQTVVVSFAMYMVIHLFLVQPNKVDGSSMFPTLHDKERILTSKITYRFEEPARRDMIVFTPPAEQNGDYVKRIIAIPGDVILLQAGDVYLNGKKLVEDYLPEGTRTAEKAFLREGKPYTVLQGEYMVFGDNRSFSSDSREWGPITRKSIIGKAWFEYWPLDEIGIIKH